MTEKEKAPRLAGTGGKIEHTNNTTDKAENQISNAAIVLLEHGFSVIPCNADKTPAILFWKPYQQQPMTIEEAREHFVNGARLAVVAGKVSGNLEILDFDKSELFKPYMETLKDINPQLAAKLIKRQTPSGGYHLLYRCQSKVRGNQKLAVSRNKETWIETRGEGGYALTSPSPGYSVLEHSLTDITTLTPENVELLHSLACSFSEIVEPEKREKQKQNVTSDVIRPGDDYNQRVDWRGLLEPEGWTFTGRIGLGGEHLFRPGKKKGTSATLKDGCLYVFSSNTVLPLGGNDAFGVYAHYHHNGNMSEAAKELSRQGYGDHKSSDHVHEWPEPTSLPVALAPVADFDFDLLPKTLRPWMEDICDRIQCAPDYVGVTVLTGLGAVIGRRIGMRPQARTDWTETANQWALVIGRPGVLKSPAMEAALSPLKRLAAEAAEFYKEEAREFESAEILAKLALKNKKKQLVRHSIKGTVLRHYSFLRLRNQRHL